MKIRTKVKLIISIIVIIALISIWTLKVMSEQGCRISPGRGIGAAINATIQAKHSDFLINAVPYTMDDVLASTSFTGGITYNTTQNNTPAMREICSNVGGTKIMCNVNSDTFWWTWTPRVGNTPALIVEDSGTAFP